MTGTCPRCGASIARGQEYCLSCGLRQPGPGRLGSAPIQRRLLPAILATLALAVGGAVTAIAVTWDDGTAQAVITATGGSITRAAPTPKQGLAIWPKGQEGWTIVLISLPKRDGRDAAVARAQQARSRRLPQVGILDSSKVASLHPGYWVVFTGVYETQPEATSALQRAKAAFRTAATRRIAGVVVS